ncbi:heterokaryon incompatibility protein-domain-containing protein [Camillea tinctor]|nr:heterokaryon incompatibility protein-domain-containing protein [Camillea tinctor]
MEDSQNQESIGHPVELYSSFPLDPSKNEIRLLKLLPGEWDSTIELEMFTACLSDNPAYDALSYVWGDQSSPHKIVVSGHKMLAGSTLFCSLRRLRAHNTENPLTIWIDAICINQEDTTEKNHQVQMMGLIYAQCRECAVWLWNLDPHHTEYFGFDVSKSWKFTGDAQDFNQTWDDLLHSLTIYDENGELEPSLRDSVGNKSLSASLHCAWFIRLAADGRHLTDFPLFKPEHSTSPYHRGLTNLLVFLPSDPWFQRLWVIQEITLAPRVRLYFGSVSVPLEVMIKAHRNFPPGNMDTFFRGNINGMDFGMSIFFEVGFRKLLDLILDLVRFRESINDHKPPLLELCFTFKDRQATLAHDRVYALLGLADSDIQVDYTKDVVSIYDELSRETILGTKQLMILSFAPYFRHEPTDNAFPSWAVDFTKWQYDFMDKEGIQLWSRQLRNFNADGGVQYSASILSSSSSSSLQVSGKRFDTIKKTSRPMAQDQLEPFVKCNIDMPDTPPFVLPPEKYGLYPDILKSHPSVDPDQPYVGGGTWGNAWWRTICRDHCWGSQRDQRASDHHIETVAIVAKIDFYRATQQQPDVDLSEMLDAVSRNVSTVPFERTHGYLRPWVNNTVQRNLKDRRLFVTEKGYLGVALETISEGDAVYILPGSRVPIILRHSEAAFTVVSDAYVHGIMDGEAMPKDSEAIEQLEIV